MSRIAPVVRRVGGLEVEGLPHAGFRAVVRRVGGLEDKTRKMSREGRVVRRVGGLEGCLPC